MTGTRPATIDCTQCGAGLDVLGGGRVRRHVCPYCNAELDAQDGYRVLRRYRDLRRPESPLAIGMTGRVDGVAVTVIGTIAMVEYHAGRSWRWVNHQVYAPTHGYAWLTWEENRLVFTRKTRIPPRPARLSVAEIEHAESRPVLNHEGRRFRYYASGIVRMTFVEGEFNFAPRIGLETRYVSTLGRDAMLTVREGGAATGGEIEYELSSLPDQKALMASFGLDPAALPRPRGVHALEPFRRSRTAAFARNSAALSALACLALALVLGDPRTVHGSGFMPIGAEHAAGFEVTVPDRLTEITVRADLDNSWAYFEGAVLDAAEETVAEFAHEIGYYHGVEGNDRWSEGSRSGSVRLRLPPGAYRLEIALAERGVWRTGRAPTRMAVEVREGVIAWWWLIVGAVAMAAVAGLFVFQRVTHNARRWSGSDWTDEDD